MNNEIAGQTIPSCDEVTWKSMQASVCRQTRLFVGLCWDSTSVWGHLNPNAEPKIPRISGAGSLHFVF